MIQKLQFLYFIDTHTFIFFFFIFVISQSMLNRIFGSFKKSDTPVSKDVAPEVSSKDTTPPPVPTTISDKEFDAAVAASKNIADATNDDKLQLYALFKQATVGPCNTPKPGVFDVVGQAKWNAWKKLGDEDAMTSKCKYVALVRKFVKDSPVAVPSSDVVGDNVVDSSEATWDRVHNIRPKSSDIAARRKKAYDLASSATRLAQFDGVPPLRRFNSLYDVLRFRASKPSLANVKAFTYLEKGETETVSFTFGELDLRARAVAAELQRTCREGDRVVLLYAQTLDFVVAFFGCIYAGVIAVPSYPPHPARMNRLLPRLIAIVEDAKPKVVLTTQAINDQAGIFKTIPQFQSLQFTATDMIPTSMADSWKPIYVDRDSICFLQYTSGSTSTPKGVMVSHFNLCYNLEIFRVSGEMSEKEVGVSWLPVFHDLGLIGGILCPVYLGFPLYLMSPENFLQHPHKWLAAMSKYRGTFSGGPNFAFDLVVRKTTPEQRAKYDLSSWRIAFCGAEPVKMATINRFCEAFPSFPRATYYPGYGLAESTLIIANSFVQTNPSHMLLKADALQSNRVIEATEEDFTKSNVCSVVSQGFVWLENEIVIVDTNTNTVVPPNTVGELWVRGPTVCLGYWNNEKETENAFHAQLADRQVPTGWLRSGDLAFVTENGEHFICGRAKDVIIINGSNYYPQDIEWASEIHTVIRKGSAAAFQDSANKDKLTLVQEVEDTIYDVDMAALCNGIARSVLEKIGLPLERIVFVKRGAIMKTSSGKIQRRATRKALEDKDMEVLFDWTNDMASTSVFSAPVAKRMEPMRKSVPTLPPNDVGIIGMGVRLPRDVSRPEALWSMLSNSQCIVSEVPMERNWERSRKFAGGFITDPFSFDSQAFGMTDDDAMMWDPQHRLLVETVQDALDDAGISRDDLKSQTCGVFVGISQREYDIELTRNGFHIDNSKSMASARVAKVFGLRGPCQSVDTACSSSLVAVHDAVLAIRAGECDMAIVGGVNLMLTSDVHVAFTRGGFLSPDGLCKTFDESANGYVRGEGVGVIVLTKANTALARNDKMYAIVKGSAINQDGRSNGLTAPNGTAQEAVIKAAILNAAIRSTDVQYVEAHGTGTALGDPIELNAIANAFGKDRLMKRELTLGSIKTNVGHLESAAGIIGLMKVALSIQKKKLPASLHFTRPNPNAKFVARCIQQTMSEWPQPNKPLIAGVSSFGFGGTNAHVILSSAPSCDETVAHADIPLVLALSSSSEEGIKDMMNHAVHSLQATTDESVVLRMCLASTIRRSHFQHRVAVQGANRDELLMNLMKVSCAEPQSLTNCMCFTNTVDASLSKALASNPTYNTALMQVQRAVAGFDSKVIVAVPANPYAIFAHQYAQFMTLKEWGVTFEACAGSGIGEVCAAVCCDLLTLEDAAAIVHVITTATSQEQVTATLNARRFTPVELMETSLAFISASNPSLPQFQCPTADHWAHVFTTKSFTSGIPPSVLGTSMRPISLSGNSTAVAAGCSLYNSGVDIKWDAIFNLSKSNVAPSSELPLQMYKRRELNAMNAVAPGAGPVYASDLDFE
eukprot:PhF_6_TR25455/c1_g1_i2/m.35224